ncbi:glycosyltransferase family 39 protein [Rhizobium rhizogenes]|jgi:4-amino-4-deoxy-L-arabinose transferase-like glycosyltransferase|uniref:glycosyltransferase family 39 protein n=2 Tax=Rhizobium rhizogenes TaxID=359 RepID=UPI00068D12A3|nr:glycosyltransferase family 39 protein [Rhizobium rhizogenes]NTF85358.1 glycosyltransferase family 39 protein [Rhizobium rhizogenes]NTI24898.1 glycosyltransferase family 39 protein [Rhizobium rhizogenes]QTG08672.1 glycosyltransferase family 39 protein [Rhizobium rhizogenes]
MFAIAALTLFRLWATAQFDLVPDEAYYWLWSRVPSAGYYDHPPMIAWWIWISTHIFGNSLLGVRGLAVVSVFVMSMAVYGIADELFDDNRIARTAAIWLNAMLLVGLAVIFATPDAPSTMFWALTLWVLARLRRTGNPRLWLLIGLLAGLGCVSKYTNLFLGPGILLWLVIDPKARPWRSSPWTLLGGGVALVAFSPVLIWNAEHGWISFAKQFGRLADQHAGLSFFAEFLAGQFGLLNPVIAIFAGIAIWRSRQEPGKTPSSPLTFLILLNGPIVAYMTFHALHDRVHANWLAPAYPALAILAAVAANRVSSVTHLRRLSYWVTPVGIGLSSLVLLCFATPFGRHFPWSSPADNVLGWREISAQVEDMRQRSGAGWIATTDYGLTGELAFEIRGERHVQQIVDRQRYFFETPDVSLVEKPALLVMRASENRLEQYMNCFQSSTPLGILNRQAGKRVIESYIVLKVDGARKDILSSGCGPT